MGHMERDCSCPSLDATTSTFAATSAQKPSLVFVLSKYPVLSCPSLRSYYYLVLIVVGLSPVWIQYITTTFFVRNVKGPLVIN